MFTTGTATNHADLLDRLDTFLTAKGSAFGLTYAGTGNGTFTAYSGGASSVAETFTITATSATNFTVVGTLAGSIGPATAGTPFSHAKLEFLITAGATPFVSGDVFELATAPKWTSHRKALGCSVLATQGNTGGLGSQNMVDGKNELDNQYWSVSTPITIPQDVEITFFESETIASYELALFNTTSPGYMPKAWDFDYWNGSSWVTLDAESGHNDWTASLVKSFVVGSPVSATKYRLHITEGNSTSYLRIGALRLKDAAGVDRAFGQTIWQAPGNDGDSEILVGVHTFERVDADYFNWELAAFDGYLATSRWREQVGHQGKLYVPLWDGSIPYWFVADGRRTIVIAKVNTQYEVAYLGLYDPYFSPEQWPYPIALGGSLAFKRTGQPDWDETSWRWSNMTAGHHAFPMSDAGLESPYYTEDPEATQLRARDLSGAWIRMEAHKNGSAPGYGYDYNFVWPYCDDLTLLDANIDAGHVVWPIIMNTFTPNTLGQLSGVGCISGQGLTSETLTRIGAIDWIALPDINRTERDDFLAIALD
jgi:hypothetical protein